MVVCRVDRGCSVPHTRSLKDNFKYCGMFRLNMKKRFLLLFFLLIYISGCATQVSETPLEPVQEETNIVVGEATAIPEESPPIDVTLNQSAVQETEVQEIKVQKPACSRKFSPQFKAAPYYEGHLFDAHFHLPPAFQDEHDVGWRMPVLDQEITIEQILCFFEKEQVTSAFLFYMWNAENLDGSIQDAAALKKQLPTGVRLFLSPLELEADTLDKIVTTHPSLFDGFGEITFYDPERLEATPDDPVSLEIYQVAAREMLVVMFHPGDNQREKVEKAVQKNPSVKFLLHGYESEDYITELMDKYPNLYYSIDSATLYPFDGIFMFGPQEKFISRFKKDFNSNLNSKVKKWKPRIEKHPDRFMWGTDRATDWHFSEEISMLFEEFARAFIGQLDPAVQEKFAYKNAERLIDED